MKGTKAITNTINKMTKDMKSVIDDAEVLLKTTRETPKVAFNEAKTRFEKTLKHAKNGALELEHEVAGKVHKAVNTTDLYARDHVWSLAGAGATIGLLVGLLLIHNHRGLEREDH